ncbi:asparagine synthase (glutamine-hydrolyzing) [Anoxynatronum sibiricum]|uniref:asparagine synthase (glutamine-hydrolyzing) n=1 Tax=Anoxynatronum sibiricum TaxID=210623 RepID=A0ABU9VUE2_9CLOT
MCSIAGVKNITNNPVPNNQEIIRVMNTLLRHRGPDGSGEWVHKNGSIALGHNRLSIIDLSPEAAQPMTDGHGNWIVYNGEIYNYQELRRELGEELFRTASDTEVILRAYERWGESCINRFRGMFSFALWDERKQVLFCARDRFGIKPFYYTIVDNVLYFASEIKALLPFVPDIETDVEGLKDYLTFQFCLEGKTLFNGIRELPPAHQLRVRDGNLRIDRYWEVYYNLDFDHTEKYFMERLTELLTETVTLHMKSDVPVGAYISGGLDSSTIASLAAHLIPENRMMGFNGRFSEYGESFDESPYAETLAEHCGFDLKVRDIKCADFLEHIQKVIYHLDYPVAGPGVLPQFLVSQEASQYRKVVLGGQGGDEIFGGYTRYLVAYFEQCIKGAIEGTMNSPSFVLTYESIIPNLTALNDYKPMLKKFWREGLFDEMDKRYFRLVNRAPDLREEIRWEELGEYSPYETFRSIFKGKNVGKESYLDQMTHFDFKTLLPALLQVEDRMSMAWGVESRVPFLDHPLVELVATMPANIKIKDGRMKHILHQVARPHLPKKITERTDKKGFPTPFTQWMKGEARDFVQDTFSSSKALTRRFVDNKKVLDLLDGELEFGRNIWGLLCLELWQQEFHDKKTHFRSLIAK